MTPRIEQFVVEVKGPEDKEWRPYASWLPHAAHWAHHHLSGWRVRAADPNQPEYKTEYRLIRVSTVEMREVVE